MNIGIDFDNTIAHYDTLFREVAMEEGIIEGNWDDKGKIELRDHLRRQPNGEKSWMTLLETNRGAAISSSSKIPPAMKAMAETRVRVSPR